MSSEYTHLLQMSQLLQQLIETENSLNETVKRVFSEEELVPLQVRQEELFGQLAKTGALLKTCERSSLDVKALKEEIKNQIKLFEHINAEFIAHIGQHHRVIGDESPAFEFLKKLAQD